MVALLVVHHVLEVVDLDVLEVVELHVKIHVVEIVPVDVLEVVLDALLIVLDLVGVHVVVDV